MLLESPNSTIDAPKPGNDDEERRPRALPDRAAGEEERSEERPGRCRGAEQPKTRRPHLEDVLGEDREQRHRASEEHREEVERDGAEEHARPADQAHAREHLPEIGGAVSHRHAARANGERERERDEGEPDPHHVDERVLDREEDAADRGPGDHRELEADRALRERGDEDLLRHEGGHQGSARRRPDRAPDSLDEREREERPDLTSAGQCDPEQAAEDEGVERDHRRPQLPPRQAVGEVPRRQREQRQRQELRERDECEVERALAHRVHLPADGDGRHRQREALRYLRREVEAEVAVRERRLLARPHVLVRAAGIPEWGFRPRKNP